MRLRLSLSMPGSRRPRCEVAGDPLVELVPLETLDAQRLGDYAGALLVGVGPDDVELFEGAALCFGEELVL